MPAPARSYRELLTHLAPAPTIIKLQIFAPIHCRRFIVYPHSLAPLILLFVNTVIVFLHYRFFGSVYMKHRFRGRLRGRGQAGGCWEFSSIHSQLIDGLFAIVVTTPCARVSHADSLSGHFNKSLLGFSTFAFSVQSFHVPNEKLTIVSSKIHCGP